MRVVIVNLPQMGGRNQRAKLLTGELAFELRPGSWGCFILVFIREDLFCSDRQF